MPTKWRDALEYIAGAVNDCPGHYVEAAKNALIPCPECYGGHFRPCQVCGDSGQISINQNTPKTMIRNFTPHEINLPDRNIPSEGSARVNVFYMEVYKHDGVSIVKGSYSGMTGLPDQQDGTLLIVSLMVKLALPGRTDLVSPGKLTRNAEGQVTGCEALEW